MLRIIDHKQMCMWTNEFKISFKSIKRALLQFWSKQILFIFKKCFNNAFMMIKQNWSVSNRERRKLQRLQLSVK